MLNLLVKFRNLILALGALAYLALWVLTLVYAEGESKGTDLLLGIILPVVLYCVFCAVVRSAIEKVDDKIAVGYILVMFIGGLAAFAALTVQFFLNFPNGFSIGIGVGVSLFISSIDIAKQRFKKE